ncbi:MAG: histidinol phosphate phosphatase [Gammaproteobacteria bacterium]|nr:histidinol phosphate phosphatase [Gammaproteobacteria bacterium]MCY4218141.1 histidinol phosphate phosphatase [Gammaproteobacteria bacterium]MCY4275250.1 histidinol phosphate phosphatase [Gammaproteobacteria bacterium]
MTKSYLKYLDTATLVADRARQIIRHGFRNHTDIQMKPDGSPVTAADLEVENIARNVILETHPDHQFFGEETGHTGHSNEWLWIIDPIDGTRSYASGRPTFGTLIALLHRGIPVIGVIDQPIMAERWIGIAGQQTTLNGRSCDTSSVKDISRTRLCITSPDMFNNTQKRQVDALTEQCGFRSYGGDCYNYGLLASGYCELVCEASLKPYDYCALVPIVEGAGGAISDWNGQALSINSCGEVLAAANPRLLEQAHLSLQ